jgi:hypothetical protein
VHLSNLSLLVGPEAFSGCDASAAPLMRKSIPQFNREFRLPDATLAIEV